MLNDVVNEVWKERSKNETSEVKAKVNQLEKLEDIKTSLLKRITTTSDDHLIKEYEKNLKEIIKEYEELKIDFPKKRFNTENFGTAKSLVIEYVKKPITMWKSANSKDQRLMLEMYFEDKMPYDIKEGFGTANLACLPKLLSMKTQGDSSLVEMSGIEPESNKAFL